MRYIARYKLAMLSAQLKLCVDPAVIQYFSPTSQLCRRQSEKRWGKTLGKVPIAQRVLNLSQSVSNSFVFFGKLPRFNLDNYSRARSVHEAIAKIRGDCAVVSDDSKVRKNLLQSISKNGVVRHEYFDSQNLIGCKNPFSIPWADLPQFGIDEDAKLIKVDKGETRFFIARELGIPEFPLIVTYLDVNNQTEIEEIGIMQFLQKVSGQYQ